jgi:hypothetical protein
MLPSRGILAGIDHIVSRRAEPLKTEDLVGLLAV